MSQSLLFKNFGEANIVERTQLKISAASSADVILVENNQNFDPTKPILVGRIGSETAERAAVFTTEGAETVNLTEGLSFEHQALSEVTVLFGDQINIYRAPNVDGNPPVVGSFASITESPVSIDFDQVDTGYTDTSGSADYWYRFTFINSISGAETDLSNSPAVRGGGLHDYVSIELVRSSAGFETNYNISDADIDVFRQEAQAVINSMLSARYTVPFTKPINPAIAAMAKEYAAGKLMIDQYGGSQAGQDKIDNVEKQLVALQNGSASLVGPGASTGSGTDPNPDTQGYSGWPNSNTETAPAADGGAKRLFRISDVQGYNERQY